MYKDKYTEERVKRLYADSCLIEVKNELQKKPVEIVKTNWFITAVVTCAAVIIQGLLTILIIK